MSHVEINAPMPGIFFSRPAPDQEPFVTVGSTVAVGDTVGLIEVMKMFQEIPADRAGVVEAVLVEDQSAVSMGQPVIRLQVP